MFFPKSRTPNPEPRASWVAVLLLIAGCGGAQVGAGRDLKAGARPPERGPAAQTAASLRPPLTVLWKVKLEASLLHPPVAGQGVVYFAMPTHKFYTMDVWSGVPVAITKVEGVAQAAPAIRDAIMVLALSGRVGRDRTELLAIDLRQYRVKWRRPILAGWSSPAVVEETLYIGSEDHALYALALETGETRWRFLTQGQVRSSPVVAHGTVFVGSDDDHLYAIQAGTGTLRWAFRTGGSIPAAPVVVDSLVYVGSYDRSLYCVEAATGRLRWRFATEGSLYGSPAVRDGRVFIGSNDRTLYCLDAATGALLWRYTTGGFLRSSPVPVGPTLYVGSSDKRLYAVDAASGAPLWQYETAGSITVSPVVVDGLLLVGSEDRYLYAFAGMGR